MKIKAVLLDFDGTSLQRDQVYLSMRNMNTLRKALDQGITIIPCTGRSEDMHPPQIEAEKRIRYWVTSAGARAVDRAKGEIIYQHTWSPEETATLCKIFEGRGIYSENAADGKIFMERDVNDHLERYRVPPHHIWFVESGRQVVVDSLSQYFLDNRIGMEKGNLYDVPEADQNEIYDALVDTGLVWMTDPVGSLIQFFQKDLDRRDAIKAVLDHIGIAPEETLAIGDNDMDIPALSVAGIGVAVGNAKQSVKEIADFITLDYEDDGVALALEKYVLS